MPAQSAHRLCRNKIFRGAHTQSYHVSPPTRVAERTASRNASTSTPSGSDRIVRPLHPRHHVVTAVWALAFAVMVAADCLLLYAPDVPPRIGIVVTILAIVGAFKFASWYPDRVRSQPVR
jgi:hypothetical protein